ncbi:MAG: hypothetical protein J7559_12085, partial [Cohnella sp.]|nr:hypothetical protein [Cohnella sp.]
VVVLRTGFVHVGDRRHPEESASRADPAIDRYPRRSEGNFAAIRGRKETQVEETRHRKESRQKAKTAEHVSRF